MKQVLIYSIQPEHVLNFLNGRKIDEIRKRDLPQWAKEALERGEVVEGYGYCTKGKPYLYDFRYTSMMEQKYEIANVLVDSMQQFVTNGKVVFKFQVSGVTPFEFIDGNLTVKYDNEAQLLGKLYMLNEQATQLTYEQLFKYMGNNKGYAHHFTNIQPIEPMELREFVSDKLVVNVCGSEFKCYNETASYFARKDQRLTKAPQSFMTAWVKGE